MRRVSVATGAVCASFRIVGLAILAILLTLGLSIPQAEASRRKQQKAASYAPPYASLVLDVNTGRTLQAINPDAPRHPASITKVMTLYMLFEQIERGRFRLDSDLPVSRFAASQRPSKLNLAPGTTISVEDAIKALITKSANDVAVVVAEAIGGTEERFGHMMTAKARSIGMTRSVFRNASGLPNPRQITTARDLVTLGRAIHDRFPRFYPYFGTRSFEFDGYAYRNHNKLLGRVEGVDGIKTGFTRASGFNLLTSAKVDGRHILVVVLGGRSGRQRDAQVASLVEGNMPRAVAGRRTPRAVEVAAAANDDDGDETVTRPAPRLAPQGVAPQAAAGQGVAAPASAPQAPATRAASISREALPLPPPRPRAAVIGDVADQGLTRPRGLAVAGNTTPAGGAATPLALVGTTPRSQALQAISNADPLPPPRENRIVPPGNVRFTNALPATTPQSDANQPLPRKVEERAPSSFPATASSGPVAAPFIPPTPVAAAPAERISAAPAQPVPVAAPAPARTGWVIQLAAAESEAKARTLLDNARERNGRLLGSAEAFTEAVTKGGTVLYRARFAGFEADEAQEACKALKRAGYNCFAQRPRFLEPP
ncbi:MAG: D-alanyl-D-alanine carboxypeptidase [Methylobacterium sp.]|nr:D-alanyl-D-alanine carboxypeptidase [Methylobacterium sp.]